MAHAVCPIEDDPFLVALAKREEALRNGRMTTILFIRDDPKENGKESKGKNQVSGYIDLADRMKTEDFR